MSLRIRGWDRYQHYRRRNPPWIKLHVQLLQSEDWVMLGDADRVLMIALLLIGSRTGGMVPDDPEYVRRVASLNQLPDYSRLVRAGFLEEAAAPHRGPSDDSDRVLSAFLGRIRGDGGDATCTDSDREAFATLFASRPSDVRRVLRGLYVERDSHPLRCGMSVGLFCERFDSIVCEVLGDAS